MGTNFNLNMIQRIQSLFLLGVVLIAVALFFIPISEKSVTEATTGEISVYTLNLAEVSLLKGSEAAQPVSSNYALMIGNLLLLTMAAYTIFLFKNRMAQMRLCMLGSLLAAVQLVLIFYYSEAMGAETTKAHYLPGVYLVAVQVFLLLASRRSIRKDEMLVRAADRIR